MKKIIIGAFAAFTLAACGGGDVCSASSKCSGDPKPTDAEKKAATDACQAAIKDGAKCAAEYKTLLTCAQSKQKCTSDNKTDNTALVTDCATEIAAYTTCLSK